MARAGGQVCTKLLFLYTLKIYPPKLLQLVEPEFTLSELRVTFVKESLVRTKAGQTVTHKVILKL